jgi:hypothetical protein
MPANAASSRHNQDELEVSTRIAYMYVAGTMMLVATVDSLVVFILSAVALEGIYGWYPQFVTQQWFIYDQLLTVFSFLGMVSGISATVLLLSRRSYVGAVTSSAVCTVSGASVLVVSLIQPLAVWWESTLYYLLPLFAASLIGTLLIYLSKNNGDKLANKKKKGTDSA